MLLHLEADDGQWFAIVGRAGISWYEDAQVHQLAYSIVQSNWGKGYASEIASALVAWFFEAEIGQRLRLWRMPTTQPRCISSKRWLPEIDTRSVRGEPCRFFEMTLPVSGLRKGEPIAQSHFIGMADAGASPTENLPTGMSSLGPTTTRLGRTAVCDQIGWSEAVSSILWLRLL